MTELFRPLTEEEISFVSGGDIVVIGTPPSTGDWGWGGGWGWGWGGGHGTGGYGSGGGGGGGTEPPMPDPVCENQATAEAAQDIKNKIDTDGLSGTRQPEYGAAIVSDANGNHVVGNVATGQSYSQSSQPSTSINIPSGYSASDVTGVIHSHPPSGNLDIDRANRMPSGGDWQAADALVAQGADPNELTMYIMDRWGVLRAYEYETPSERNATASNPAGNTRLADGTTVDYANPTGC